MKTAAEWAMELIRVWEQDGLSVSGTYTQSWPLVVEKIIAEAKAEATKELIALAAQDSPINDADVRRLKDSYGPHGDRGMDTAG